MLAEMTEMTGTTAHTPTSYNRPIALVLIGKEEKSAWMLLFYYHTKMLSDTSKRLEITVLEDIEMYSDQTV